MAVEWAVAGAVVLVGLLFSLRLMRRGLGTLEQKKSQYMERIRQEELRLAEDKKNISLSEHLHILYAGVEDLLRLEGNPPGYSLTGQGCVLVLQTPQGPWQMELIMRELSLRQSPRVLHGRSRWVLRGFGQEEFFEELAPMMCSLNRHLHGDMGDAQEPSYLARRIRH